MTCVRFELNIVPVLVLLRVQILDSVFAGFI